MHTMMPYKIKILENKVRIMHYISIFCDPEKWSLYLNYAAEILIESLICLISVLIAVLRDEDIFYSFELHI